METRHDTPLRGEENVTDERKVSDVKSNKKKTTTTDVYEEV